MLSSMFTFQINNQTDDLFGYIEPYFSCCVYVHLCIHIYVYMGSPDGLDGKESSAMWGTWVQSLGWEDPLEEGMATHPVFLPGESPWVEEPGRL